MSEIKIHFPSDGDFPEMSGEMYAERKPVLAYTESLGWTQAIRRRVGNRIEFLFECDGIKMYRFYDCGKVRYFTTGNGRMTDSVHTKKSVTRDDTVIQ